MKLITLALLALASPALAEAQLSAAISLPHSIPGGLSALEVADNGTDVVLMTDRGVFLTGRLVRQNGKLADLTILSTDPLHDPDGQVVEFPDFDSEGLAVMPDGRRIVSFEGKPRIWVYDTPSSNAAPIRSNTAFNGLQPNSGLEALAAGPDGTLYTIPERSGRQTRPFPVWRYRSNWDVAFEIPRRDVFLVTGADVGPDGRLYVLERDFVGIGFRSRVRRFNMDGSGEEVVFETALGTHSNLEGISVWRDDTGHLRLTMVSDNNENMFFASTLVEYQLDN